MGFAGLLVGMLYQHVTFKSTASFTFIMALGLSLTISISSLRVFGGERLVMWREAAPGAGMWLAIFCPSLPVFCCRGFYIPWHG